MTSKVNSFFWHVDATLHKEFRDQEVKMMFKTSFNPNIIFKYFNINLETSFF